MKSQKKPAKPYDFQPIPGPFDGVDPQTHLCISAHGNVQQPARNWETNLGGEGHPKPVFYCGAHLLVILLNNCCYLINLKSIRSANASKIGLIKDLSDQSEIELRARITNYQPPIWSFGVMKNTVGFDTFEALTTLSRVIIISASNTTSSGNPEKLMALQFLFSRPPHKGTNKWRDVITMWRTAVDMLRSVVCIAGTVWIRT